MHRRMVEKENASQESREKRMADIEAQIASLKQELDNLKAQDPKDNSENVDWQENTDWQEKAASVDTLDVDNLYWWNRWKPITKQEVMDTVNNLKEPYHTDISRFIRNKDILWLQKYLNEKIKEWKIDAKKLEEALKAKWIRFDWAILEDWKFWPQTLEAIKFILEQQEEEKKDEKKPEDKKEPEQVEPTEEEKKNITNINIIINQYFIFVDGKRTLNPERPLPGWKLVIWDIEYPEWHEWQKWNWFRIIGDRIVIGIFDESGHINWNTIIIDKSWTIMVWIIENWKKTWRWVIIDKTWKIIVIIIKDPESWKDPVDPGYWIYDPIFPIWPITPKPPKKWIDPVDPGYWIDNPYNPTFPKKPGDPIEISPKNPEDKEILTPHWIEDEMRDILDNLRSGATKWWDWSSRRNYASWKETCKEDTKNKKAILTTYGSSFEGGLIENNTCELDWKTWNIHVYCGKNKYLMPVRSQPLDLDKNWYPKHTPENINKVRAFTEVWNLMNFLKANYIFNGGPYSFEESGWDLEYNNGTFNDTEIVSNEAFNTLSTKYRSAWIVFNIWDRRHMACLLNWMKLDKGNLTLDELEDGCTDEDVALSKRYSQKYS